MAGPGAAVFLPSKFAAPITGRASRRRAAIRSTDHSHTAAPQTSPLDGLALPTARLPWEIQIAQVLNTAPSDSAKARELLRLLPSFPEEALATATQEAASRLRDVDYVADAQPILTNPQTNGAILSELFSDLLARPDPVALPALLLVARTRNHPFAAPAHENLEHLLSVNCGDDWSAWDAAIQRSLAAPPR